MKILYLSCHSVLEYDEVKLLTELGHEVQSHGAYRDPRGAYTLPRPGIEGIPFDQDFFDLTANHPKTALPPELIEPYDTIIIMAGEHERPLIQNWENIKHKRVIWRTIGQSTPAIENSVKKMRSEGLQIIRYSPKEENLFNYAGGDVMIRFYKDPAEFNGWHGNDIRPINFTQSLRGRGHMVHYDEVMGALVGFKGAKVYGTGNDDLGSFNGGEKPFEVMKKLLRDSRVFVYTGTWPASYTLSFIEAMMTGIPIVALNAEAARPAGVENFDYYEVEEIIKSCGIECAGNVQQMRSMIQKNLYGELGPYNASKAIRKRAIELFGKATIKEQWCKFLEG